MVLRRTRYSAWFGVLALEVLLLGCTASVPAATPTATEPMSTSSTDIATASQQQMLPITAQVKIADQVIELEVANTPIQQQIGLMNRKELADNRGMLFPFNPPRLVGFWMKNCLINLDMIFLHQGKVLSISANVPPCKTEPCPVYGPEGFVDQVIELRGGRAKELGIKVGDQLTVQPRK